MMKTRKLFLIILILVGLPLFVAQEILAECPDGLEEFTLVTPRAK